MSFDPENFELPFLLPRITKFDLETKEILKKCTEAHKYLGRLKEACNTIPNADVITYTLTLREAHQSSAIENIVTTQDEIFQNVLEDKILNKKNQEVINYHKAISHGSNYIREKKVLSLECIKDLFQQITNEIREFRSTSVHLGPNRDTVIYRPPTNIQKMNSLLEELEQYINCIDTHDIDDLIRLCIIHYQFESIHPFRDGNGRTGRIMNILCLVLYDILDYPVLYLSKYINETKDNYYRGLQDIRIYSNTDQELYAWQKYINYMLDCIIKSAKHDLEMIHKISGLMKHMKTKMRENKTLEKIYDHDLINHLFMHPYTKIEYIAKLYGVVRQTASSKLSLLVEHNFLEEMKIGNEKYFINNRLWAILSEKS